MATETEAQGAAGATETVSPDEFSDLLKQSFKSRTERAASDVDNAIGILINQALSNADVIKDDVLDTIDEMIARLDQKLSEQMNEIMHNPVFQQLESAWKGLSHLIFNSETDANLKIKVMNVSKGELFKTLKSYPGARWDQSPLFKKLYEHEFGQLGGQPGVLSLPADGQGSRGSPCRPWRRAASARSLEGGGGLSRAVLYRYRAQADGHGYLGRDQQSA